MSAVTDKPEVAGRDPINPSVLLSKFSSYHTS